MRYLKKLCIFVFALFVCFSLVKVNAIGPELDVDYNLGVLGASVRTTGNAGIRFEANIGAFDDSDVKAYGILIAYGLTSTNDNFCKGGTVNGKAVLSVEVDEVDAEGKYYATIYNVPSNQYVQDITARAYVVLNDDSIVYGLIPTNRCLAEVVVKAHDDEVEGDIITTVYNTIERISIDEETSNSFYLDWYNQYNIYYYEKCPNYIVKADLDNEKDNVLVEYKDENPVNNVMVFFKKGETAFDTISGVLDVAGVEKENANEYDDYEGVFVFNGEYDEDIALDKCSLYFETANANLNMSHSDVYVEDATSQVIIDGKVTITGNYINIYGFVFKNQIEIAGVDNVWIYSSITNYTDTAVLVSSASSNLIFQSFYQAGSGARCIYVQAPVTNFEVNGFVVLDQAELDATVGEEANLDNIRFGITSEQYAKGNIIIQDCYFRAIQMGICDRNPSADYYEIKDNYFKQCKTAIQLRSGTNANEMEYVIKANTFDNCGRIKDDWYALEMYTNANTTAKVNYNLFLDSEFNGTTPIIKVYKNASASYDFQNNYFWDSVNKDTNDFGATNFCSVAKEDINLTLWELQQYGSTYETDEDIYTVVYLGGRYYIYGLSVFGPENVVE